MMEATLVPLDTLVGLIRNPKDHDVGEISESIERFGFIHRIIVNRASGHIIGGHGRVDSLRIMKLRRYPPPPGVEKNGKDWLVPIDYIDIPEEEEEAAAIALNRLEEIGGWDDMRLPEVLADLAKQGEEMLKGIGFDMEDVDEMLRKMEKSDLYQETEEDREESLDLSLDEFDSRLEERAVELGIEPGQVWRVGNHFVACGDSTDHAVWNELMIVAQIEKVGGIFTSPPYAEQRDFRYGGISEKDYVNWWNGLQMSSAEYLADDGSFFVNIKPHVNQGERSLYVFDLVIAMTRKWGWKFIEEYSWERISAPGNWPNRFKNGFEPIYHFAKNTRIKFHPDAVTMPRAGKSISRSNVANANYFNNDTIVWSESRPSNRIPSFGNATKSGHSAAFPANLPMFFMLAFSDNSDTWVDPFAGSGTVGVAAERCGRSAVMIEIMPKYVALILDRLTQETGDSPVLT